MITEYCYHGESDEIVKKYVRRNRRIVRILVFIFSALVPTENIVLKRFDRFRITRFPLTGVIITVKTAFRTWPS